MPNENPPVAGFKDHPENINKKGRPRQSLTFKKLKKYSTEEILSAYWKISGMKRDDVKKFNDDKTATLLEMALVKRMAKGDVDVIINRIMGMPKEFKEHSGSLGIGENLTSEEREDKIKQLLELRAREKHD